MILGSSLILFSLFFDQRTSYQIERRSARKFLLQSSDQTQNYVKFGSSKEVNETEVKTLHAVTHNSTPTGPNPLHN